MKKLFFILCAIVCITSAAVMCYGGYLNYVSEKNVFKQLNDREIVLEGVRVRYDRVNAVHSIKHLFLEPFNHVDVIARQSGTISKILVKPYEAVAKNQVLAIMESKELEAQVAEVGASLSKAKTARDRARISYQRYAVLVEKGAVSGEQYDDAKAGYEGAISEVKSLEAQKEAMLVRKDQLILRAPADGFVSTFYYPVNSYVNASTPVMLLEDKYKMVYYESISEDDFCKLFPLPEKWTLYLDESDHHSDFAGDYTKKLDVFSKGFNASIERIFPPEKENAVMRYITWVVDNDSYMLHNLHYKNAKFVSNIEMETLVIPLSALHGTKDEVYVWSKGNIPSMRKIKTGHVVGDWIQVREGLTIDEMVIITDPMFFNLVLNRRFTIKEISPNAERRSGK